MKAVVISDPHGDFEAIQEVVKENPKMDLYLCLGDSCLKDISPFTSVKGNCDLFLPYPLFINIDTPYGLMHLEHGLYGYDENYVLNKGCKIFLSGHTHRKEALKYNDVYVFNPGSISRPRDGSKSYLVLDISKDDVKYEFKYL